MSTTQSSIFIVDMNPMILYRDIAYNTCQDSKHFTEHSQIDLIQSVLSSK